jgi:hypothetical protein
MAAGLGGETMLPEGITITTATASEDMPSTTWEINFDNKRIAEKIDGLKAVKQMIHLTLITEYQYSEIYENFGLKIADLIGQDFFFILSELRRRISEALLKDTRILRVENFTFEEAVDVILVSFSVFTIYGAVEHEEVISV